MIKNLKIKINNITSAILIIALIGYVIVDICRIRTNKQIIETNYKIINIQKEINKEIEEIMKYVEEL